MRWLMLLACAVALTAPAWAQGDLPYPTDRPVSNARTITAIAAAQELLPDGACAPRFYVAALPADIGGIAMSTPGLCVGWLAPEVALGGPGWGGWTGRIFGCSIVEHEALHELGYVSVVPYVGPAGTVDPMHSPDRRSVMWPFAGETATWPCAHRFLPRGRGVEFRRDFPGVEWATFP